MRFLREFGELRAAEKQLMQAAASGVSFNLSSTKPDHLTPENGIRAEFIRFLALGGDGDAPIHESGVRLRGAYVEGDINLDGTEKVRPLWLQDCVISGKLTFFDAYTRVIGLDGSSVAAIRGDRAKIDGSLLLRRGFSCQGSIRMPGVLIDGSLECEGGIINGETGRGQNLAINLSTATIKGNVEFSHGFRANGLIWLDDAKIGGLFDCTRGEFHAAATEGGLDPDKVDRWDKRPRALKCHRLNLSGSLYLRGARCEGEISFTGAEIGGDLDCRQGQFCGTDKDDFVAIRFTRVDVGGNVYLSHGFETKGKVLLDGAHVSGNIDCHDGTFIMPPQASSTELEDVSRRFSRDVLSFVNAKIEGALMFMPIERSDRSAATICGSIDFKCARVSDLVDGEAAWPKRAVHFKRGELRDVIHLDGFVYKRLAGSAPVEAEVRKKWLRCQPPAHLDHNFKPQPFEQLIQVLQDMGHPEQARRIAIERQGYFVDRRLRKWHDSLGAAFRAVGALLWLVTIGYLIGHGYRPFRVVTMMAVVTVLCGLYYQTAADQGAFAPRDPQMFITDKDELKKCRPGWNGNWTKCDDPNFIEYPQFNPWVYSLEAILPLIDLKQHAAWGPIRREVIVSVPHVEPLTLSTEATRYVIVGQILFGWLGSLLAVAAFSGLVKSDR